LVQNCTTSIYQKSKIKKSVFALSTCISTISKFDTIQYRSKFLYQNSIRYDTNPKFYFEIHYDTKCIVFDTIYIKGRRETERERKRERERCLCTHDSPKKKERKTEQTNKTRLKVGKIDLSIF